MPGYKTHLVAGTILPGAALAGAVWQGWYDPTPLQAATLLAIAAMSSLFPDTDTCSMGRKIFYGVMLFTDIVLLVNHEYKWASILGLFAMLPALGEHRGWTHTWWAMLAVPAPIVLIPMYLYQYAWQILIPFYVAAVAGYATHLLLDRTIK